MSPECELEIELKYAECLKCKDRDSCKLGKDTIAFWENHAVKKYHKKIEENGLNLKKKGGEK